MSLQRLSAWGGAVYIGDSTPRTGKDYHAFQVNEDCTVSELSGTDLEGNVRDLLNEMELDGSPSPTLKQGTLIIAPLDCKISNITVDSGSVIAYR